MERGYIFPCTRFVKFVFHSCPPLPLNPTSQPPVGRLNRKCHPNLSSHAPYSVTGESTITAFYEVQCGVHLLLCCLLCLMLQELAGSCSSGRGNKSVLPFCPSDQNPNPSPCYFLRWLLLSLLCHRNFCAVHLRAICNTAARIHRPYLPDPITTRLLPQPPSCVPQRKEVSLSPFTSEELRQRSHSHKRSPG